MESKELQQVRTQRRQDMSWGVLRRDQRNDGDKIKHNIKLVRIAQSLLVGLAISGPSTPMVSTMSMPSLSWPKDPCLPSNPSVLAVQTSHRAICMGSSLCQGPDVRTHIQNKVFIRKVLPLNGLAPGTIMVCKSIILTHKSRN